MGVKEMKDAYVAKMEAQLAEWGAKLKEMKAKAEKAAAQGRIEYQKKLEQSKAQEKHDQARQKLNEMKAAGERRRRSSASWLASSPFPTSPRTGRTSSATRSTCSGCSAAAASRRGSWKRPALHRPSTAICLRPALGAPSSSTPTTMGSPSTPPSGRRLP